MKEILKRNCILVQFGKLDNFIFKQATKIRKIPKVKIETIRQKQCLQINLNDRLSLFNIVITKMDDKNNAVESTRW